MEIAAKEKVSKLKDIYEEIIQIISVKKRVFNRKVEKSIMNRIRVSESKHRE